MIIALIKALIKKTTSHKQQDSSGPANAPRVSHRAPNCSQPSKIVLLLRRFDSLLDFLPLICMSALTTPATISCVVILCLSVLAAVIAGVRKFLLRDKQAIFPSYLTAANIVISAAMLAVFATHTLPNEERLESAIFTSALCVAMLLSLGARRPFTAERSNRLPEHLRAAPAFRCMHGIITGYVVLVMLALSAAGWVRALSFAANSTGSRAISWGSTAVTALAFSICIRPVAMFAKSHAGWTEEQAAELKALRDAGDTIALRSTQARAEMAGEVEELPV